jgi:hypothetical protein
LTRAIAIALCVTQLAHAAPSEPNVGSIYCPSLGRYVQSMTECPEGSADPAIDNIFSEGWRSKLVILDNVDFEVGTLIIDDSASMNVDTNDICRVVPVSDLGLTNAAERAALNTKIAHIVSSELLTRTNLWNDEAPSAWMRTHSLSTNMSGNLRQIADGAAYGDLPNLSTNYLGGNQSDMLWEWPSVITGSSMFDTTSFADGETHLIGLMESTKSSVVASIIKWLIKLCLYALLTVGWLGWAWAMVNFVMSSSWTQSGTGQSVVGTNANVVAHKYVVVTAVALAGALVQWAAYIWTGWSALFILDGGFFGQLWSRLQSFLSEQTAGAHAGELVAYMMRSIVHLFELDVVLRQLVAFVVACLFLFSLAVLYRVTREFARP